MTVWSGTVLHTGENRQGHDSGLALQARGHCDICNAPQHPLTQLSQPQGSLEHGLQFAFVQCKHSLPSHRAMACVDMIWQRAAQQHTLVVL
jgi:hypothetical protein